MFYLIIIASLILACISGSKHVPIKIGLFLAFNITLGLFLCKKYPDRVSEIHREYSIHENSSYSNRYYDEGSFTITVMQQEDGVYEEESYAKDLIQYDFTGEEKPHVTMYIRKTSATKEAKFWFGSDSDEKVEKIVITVPENPN